MPQAPTYNLIYHLIVFQLVLIVTVLSNLWTLRRTGRHPRPARFPRVSVLVPARNEEDNVERCARSLLAQDYPDFEVLVLDDQSTDRTRAILNCLAGQDPRLRVLGGRPLAEGWLGKNWACAQLADQATGDVLFFTDADTVHAVGALSAMVTAMEGECADLLSGFTHQEMQTWGERLLVPFFSWALLCFVPLWAGYRIRVPALSCAVGQMLLIRRSVYRRIGGHAAVRASVAEDLALARRITAFGYRWRMMQAVHLISCRMYRGGQEAYAGLSKNLFAAFEFRAVPYVFAWLWLIALFFRPIFGLGALILGLPAAAPPAATVACIGLALCLWLLAYRQVGIPLGLAALYPATVAANEVVAFRSLWLSLTGRLSWKGRPLRRPRVTLF